MKIRKHVQPVWHIVAYKDANDLRTLFLGDHTEGRSYVAFRRVTAFSDPTVRDRVSTNAVHSGVVTGTSTIWNYWGNDIMVRGEP